MSIVHVEIMGKEEYDRLGKLLADIPNGAVRALKSAMPRAANYLHQNSARAIQERYDISTTAIRASENVTIRYTYHEGVQAYVKFAGDKIPLYRYGGASPGAPAYDQSQRVPMMIHGQWRIGHPGIAAHAHQLKGTAPALFEHAFVARMNSGHIGIFERTGGKSRTGGDAITEIMGSSVSQMLGREEIKNKLAHEAGEKFLERYHHEVTRLLNGWGG